MRTSQANQQGAALLVVLALVGSLSVLALGLTQTMLRSVSQVEAAQARDRAQWALLGAETAALHLLEVQDQLRPGVDLPSEAWLAQPLEVPVEGGVIEARFIDRSACFNINSFVTAAEGGGLASDPVAIGRFGQMVADLGGDVRAGAALAGAAADFMDTDDYMEPGGAEDSAYSRGAVPYRTAKTFFADVSELRAVRGWGREVYGVLAPYLCVRPSSKDAFGLVNINTLTPADAPLLRTLVGERLPMVALERLIETRPPDGYNTVEAFLAVPLFQELDPPLNATVAQSLATHAAYIEFYAELSYGDYGFAMTSMIEKAKGQDYRVVSRRMGAADR